MSDAVDVLNGVIATKDAEIGRLRDDLARMYRLRRECVALADDLAARLGIYAEEFEMHEDIDVLARYRKARER